MKQIIIGFIITIIAFNAAAQNTFTTTYNDVKFTKGGVVPTFTLYSENTFTKDSKFGYSVFMLVTKDWAEAMPGVFYKITGKDVVGVQIGMETVAPYYRVSGSYIHFGDKQGAFFKRLLVKAFAEQGSGKGNYWYHVSIDYQTKDWRIGTMSRRFYGTGVRVEYQKNGSKFMIGGAGLYDTEVSQFKPTLFIGWNF